MGDCLSLSFLVLLFFGGGSKASALPTGFTGSGLGDLSAWPSGARVSLLLHCLVRLFIWSFLWYSRRFSAFAFLLSLAIGRGLGAGIGVDWVKGV
jgi:hypothetical protein